MRTIIKILGVEKAQTYTRTHAVVDDGTECVGFGEDFKLGDKVEVFFHYETIKMRKPS